MIRKKLSQGFAGLATRKIKSRQLGTGVNKEIDITAERRDEFQRGLRREWSHQQPTLRGAMQHGNNAKAIKLRSLKCW